VTARFVLDESSWFRAVEVGANELSNAILELLGRLDIVNERNEGVVKHLDFYESDLGDGIKLYSVLFELDCPLLLEYDVKVLLALALDRIGDFDDSTLVAYDVEFNGITRFAPGVAWGHACCTKRHQVAMLPLPLSGVSRGEISVTVESVINHVFFVVEEYEHLMFFRTVIEVEKADEEMFEHLASSAFPALGWADDVWRGLKLLSRPYVDVRSELIRYLGALNDHGAHCFSQYLEENPQQLSGVLSSRVGAETSDENGRTKRHAAAIKDRTRSYRGDERVFWWHVKLRPNVDRIHFLYEPVSAESSNFEYGRIIVGLFKDHCILPG